jgi:hypothetical protein
MRCSNDGAPTITVRSRIPGSAAGCRIGRPSYSTPSNPAQYSSQVSRSWQIDATASHSWSLATQPDGNDALFKKTTRVRSVTAAASLSRSSRHCPSLTCSGTSRGAAPTNRTRLSMPA